MILELLPGIDLWIVMPDGTNVHIDPNGERYLVEHWSAEGMTSAMSLAIAPPESDKDLTNDQA